MSSRVVLIAGVSANLLLLGYFKYTDFGLGVMGSLLHRNFVPIDVILPLAISFFTFTQISYLVDIYRDPRVHYRFVDYSLFIAFFPHLIAGPILRHWEIVPQFLEKGLRTTLDDVAVGCVMFFFGLIKKIFFADSLAAYANPIYTAAADSHSITTIDAWLGTLAFALQIYFDFSSYSDMAIGLARIFGIKFPPNFDSPYQAPSVIVFWERWHMTLTRFLREYVYYSLGGNRLGHSRQGFNIIATMLISGLWHGAGWTFILWGGLYGIYIIIAHQWRLLIQRIQWLTQHFIYRSAMILLTFIAVLFAWVLFRSPDLNVAENVLASMTAWNGITVPAQITVKDSIWDKIFTQMDTHYVSVSALPIDQYSDAIYLILALLAICWFMPNTQQLLCRYDPVLTPVNRPSWFYIKIDWKLGLVLGFLGFLMVRFSYVAPPNPFIYFNF